MQLFSRNKALAALSLGALAALGACGDDVTVPVAPAAPVVISITPPSASMNVGESLNFAVQISGGSTTAAPTLASCTSSNAAVATAAVQGSACRVTAVAAGNATVTAAASTGQVAAASITVAAPAPAISGLSVSPSAVQLAVGGTAPLTPNVNRANTSVNVAYTYTSSAASVATVSAAGVVTAVAPGTATITVSAAGTGTGFTATTLTAAATVTVSERTPGLTALQVSPTTATLPVGGTQGLTASVQGPRAADASITYSTSAPAIATVSATGTITAVAAGTATITVTAQSTESGAFAASSITGLVAVTVLPNAQVAITSLTQNRGSVVDLSNVYDQLEVNLAIQPNGQTVSEVNVWVCQPGQSVADCAAATNGVPAARQSFTAAGTQATNVQTYINTAEFTTPNFETGADANTLYKNGLRTIVATLTTAPSTGATIASNSISSVNFNNEDGWTIRWTPPANRANDVGNVTWYGGPSTPDALTPNAQSGTGSFVVVPVIYTPDRTVVQATLNLSSACGSNITDRTRPFAGTYGTATRDTLGVNFNCTGVLTATSGLAPQVIGGVDNNNNGYAGTAATPAVARSIFNDFTNIANGTVGGYRQSLAYRQNYLYLPHDYAAPVISSFDVRGGSNGTTATQDSAWVNGDYFLAGANPLSSTSSLRYRVGDTTTAGLPGVGLLSTNGGGAAGASAASRNTLFSVCALPAVPTTTPTAAINCTSPVATGGISATIASMNVPESSTNFTNTAYFAQVAETDRLGNRATSVVYTWDNTAVAGPTATAARTPARNASQTGQWGPAVFGVDLTPPVLATIPNSGAGSTSTLITNFARTDADSIFSSLGNSYGSTNNTNAQFAIRFTDNRSGFFTCVLATASANNNCPSTGNASTQVSAGTFAIQRRTAPTLATVTNDAVSENIIRATADGAADRSLNRINAVVSSFDAAYREFAINIFGAPNRVSSQVTLTGPTPAATVAGYYTFSGTLTDRAGNSTTIPSRTVAIDNANPQITGITVPGVLAGGTTVTFGPSGTDDLEAISGDLSLRYPQLAFANGFAATADTTLPNTIRFRRVNNFSQTAALGLWHNPFAAVTDNKLATPIGPGTLLGAAGLTVPVPFIQQIATVRANSSPMGADSIFALFSLSARDPRPNQVGARLYDIRATSPLTGFGNGRSTELTVPIFGGNIPTPSSVATTKNWRDTTGGVGIQFWQVHVDAAGNTEFRAQTSTSITNPPFTSVYIVRLVGSTEPRPQVLGYGLEPATWEYIGTATYAGPLDQGGNRFWRWTITSSSIDQGNGAVMAALANGDQIKAIGVDASGNGLSTRTSTFGLNLAIAPGSTVNLTFSGDTIVENGDLPTDIDIAVSNSNTDVQYTYACTSSNEGLARTTIVNGNVCRIETLGSVVSAIEVQITVTVTGTKDGYATNTISTTRTITRRPVGGGS